MAKNCDLMESFILMFYRQQPVSKSKHDIYYGLRTLSFVFSYSLYNDAFITHIIQSTENVTLHYEQFVRNREPSDFCATVYSMA